MIEAPTSLRTLDKEIVACRKCPRLVEYREKVAKEKRRAYRDWTYWGKPVPGFGEANAELLIPGLAPAALHKAGFANQPTSLHRDDGLQLTDAYITATIRCAPPENKPLPEEILNCRGYLERELEILQPKAVLALGKIAWDAYLEILKQRGIIPSRAPYVFAHGAEAKLPPPSPRLFGVYHPSQQNTQTGRVTPAMYAQVLRRIRRFLEE
jgi:uracil-DNA glycosylase family 4